MFQIVKESNDIEKLINDTLNEKVTKEELRLPNTLHPLHYRLWIHPILDERGEKNFTFSGRVKILINCLEETNKIIMNWDELNITDSDISVYTTEEVQISPQPLQADSSDGQHSTKRDLEETGEENNETTTLYVDEDDSVLMDDSVPITTEETTTVTDVTDTTTTTTMQIPESFSEGTISKTELLPWPVKEISMDEENLKLVITTVQNLRHGENYTVDIKFSGQILNNLVGLYRTHYIDLSGNTR